MKKIIYCLVLSLFIFNCSKSDDDNLPESCTTFLECNDGSTWILDDDIVVIILRINDNINDPLEQWFTIIGGADCYDYLSDILADYTITENTKDKLVFKADWGAGDIQTLTFSIVNGELKIIDKYILDGENIEDVRTLPKTTIDVDNLTICP
mgnify:CR=1 FL=1|jgi:hypothetical protein